MASEEDLLLLKHPLTKAWLKYKWNAYARWIFVILMVIRAFSFIVLVCLLNRIRKSVHPEKKSEEGEDMFPHSLAVPPVLMCLLLTSIVVQLVVEANSLYRLRCANSWPMVLVRLVSFFLTLLALVFAYGHCGLTCDKTVYYVGIPALILAGLHFIFVVDQLPCFNLLTSINRHFLWQYLKGLSSVVCIVTLFAFIFHLLLCDQKAFKTMGNSVLSIALWQVGDFNQEMFFEVEAFRTFFHFLFIMYLITFGALIVTIIRAPSITRKASELNKEIGTINLIFEIDVCFPCFRKVCEGNQSDINNDPGIWTKLKNQLGLKKKCEEENEGPVEEMAVHRLSRRYQRSRIFKEDEGESDNAHDLLLGKLDELSRDMKKMQCQIHNEIASLLTVIQGNSPPH